MDFKSDKTLINSDFIGLLNYSATQEERMAKMRKDDRCHLLSAAFFIVLVAVLVYVLCKGLVMRGFL